MNKKLLLFTLIPLIFSVMMAPAMAKPIGPRGRAAEKNPNLEITPEGEVELLLPSGVGHIWMDTDWGVMDSSNWKNASKFKIRKATTLTVDDLINMMLSGDLTYENKWTYASLDVLIDLMDWYVDMEFLDEDEADEMKDEFESMFPQGMYLMFVNVGK